MRVFRYGVLIVLGSLLGCQATNPPEISKAHINKQVPSVFEQDIPPLVQQAPLLPKPSKRDRPDTFTVVVDQVPIKELLFSIAQDANLNIDLDPQISGRVTVNAINQPLSKILDRLTELNNIRYEIDGNRLLVRVDSPYFKSYRIRYLNMARDTKTSIELSTEISSSGAEGSSLTNNSQTSVTNNASNEFWKTIEANLRVIVGAEEEGQTAAPAAAVTTPTSSTPATPTTSATENTTPTLTPTAGIPAAQATNTASALDVNPESAQSATRLIVNRESGIIGIKASRKQHVDVQAFLDEVMGSAQRQVLIEATLAEVTLSDTYQAGVDWSAIQNGDLDALNANSNGVNLLQSVTGANLADAPNVLLKITNTDINGSRVDATLKALEKFGNVEIMSSPKLMALNNQTAVLKVVDNQVYFTIEVENTVNDLGYITGTQYETNLHTVPIGFVMSVTPYIDEFDAVTLNVRPSLSRIIGQAQDPNPALAAANVISEIPIVQVREIESILKVNNGDIAVIGGLMQDDRAKRSSGVPWLSGLPWIGGLFRYQDDSFVKTELVIFIKPVVVYEPDINKDLQVFKSFLKPAESRK
jgi:general secretion pathway protein D